MEMCQCNGCGKHLSVNSIRRHKKKSCNGKGEKAGTIDSSDQQSDATSHIDGRLETSTKESVTLKSKNPRLTPSVVNKIINTTPNEHIDGMIQPSIGNGKDNSMRNPDKIPTIHEAAKQLKIIPESDDESEGSIVGDEYESEEEDDEDMEVDPTKENETVIYEDESHSENITKDELKARLYTLSNIMKVFG